MKEHVVIKSNKYGLTVFLDPDIPYEELLTEIRGKFEVSRNFFQETAMAISFENRVLAKEEEQEIVTLISEVAKLHILCIIDYDESTEQMYKSVVEETLAAIPEPDGQFYRGTLKKRQVLETETSIVVIGDVEEGATIVSKGNIVVIGTIWGAAQAGVSGNPESFIAALAMEPAKLRIGNQEVKPVIGGSYSWAKLS